jgi:oxygen-independent coproporphyrinogen-3 oxidase
MTDVELSPSTLAQVARALASVPRGAYSVPHVYPAAAPAYESAPKAERPHPDSDHLRLYVHVPYCRYHCSFCHYAVRVGANAAAMARYVRALGDELAWVEPGTPLSQLFMGGGTPTALPPDLLDAVLAGIFGRMPPHGRHVHTVETSPETISPGHVEVLKRRGIGRVSMGIQSLDDDVLGTVHRRHSSAQALAAVDLLVGSGLILNVDLIYGLPHQTPESFLRDLRALAERGVPSFTTYSLRLNERTPVARVLREDERFDLSGLMRWRALVARGAQHLGYVQTRWHTWKRLDSRAREHERLAHYDDSGSGYQLGIGVSARSHLRHAVYRNHDNLDVYLERVERGGSPVEQVLRLGETDRMTQLIARSIGDGKPLARVRYERAFGRPIDEDFGDVVARLTEAGLVDDDGATLALSELGKLAYDVVTLAFYPPHAREWLARRGERVSLIRSDTATPSS